jgi:small GTP-binding protein
MNADSSESSSSKIYTSAPIPDYQWELLPDDFTKYDLSFKLIVIGDSGVGKSCLTNKATKNIFEECYNATVGFEFFSFNLRMDGRVIKMQIWDTCGQELYRSLITNFYRNSSLAVMVYSITSKDSYDNVDVWLKELKMHSNPDAKVFLIGNKIDLENERKVEFEQGVQFAKENGLDLFMESSAKTGLNAQKIFIEAAKVLYADYLKYKEKRSENNNSELGNSVMENSDSGVKLNNGPNNEIQPNTCAC